MNKKFLTLILLATTFLVQATEQEQFMRLLVTLSLLSSKEICSLEKLSITNLSDCDKQALSLAGKAQSESAKQQMPHSSREKYFKPKSINRFNKFQQKRGGVGGYNNTGRKSK
jgi:hypothetical protein